MTQVQQDLEAAYDVLEAHGWCRGSGQTRDGRVCLEGAVAQATLGDATLWATRRQHEKAHREHDGYRPTEWVPMSRERLDRYADALDALTLRLPAGTSSSLFMWNDWHATTVEDVKDLIKSAIKAEAEK